ncbi:MAG: hypothetical protein WAL32_04805 [Terriglobales bacterium]
MKSYFKFVVAFCVLALSICASAGSVQTFNYSANVTGVSNTTVQATFKYNTSTDTFTLASLAFSGNSIFDGIGGTVNQQQQGDTFIFSKTISGYTVSYTIVLNPLNGSYVAYGSIAYGSTKGAFQYDHQVPEGGTRFSYLAASGLTLFAGVVLAGKQRRRPAEN